MINKEAKEEDGIIYECLGGKGAQNSRTKLQVNAMKKFHSVGSVEGEGGEVEKSVTEILSLMHL